MENKINKTFLTTRDVAERFSIPAGTLANLRCQKRGPRYFKPSRRVLYRESDVRAWIEENPVLTIDSVE